MSLNGKYVKCLLINNSFNLTVEGFVIDWGSEVILKDGDNNISIITHPEEDIRVIKVIEPPAINKPKTKIEEEWEQVYEEHHNPHDDLRNKKMAELKIALNEQERKIISDRLKDHSPSTLRLSPKDKYGTPGFLPQQKPK